PEVKDAKGAEIIEKFLKEDPTIKPPKPEQIDTENKAKKSAEDHYDLVSETLARALNKYEQLKQQFTTQNGNSYERLVEILGNRDKKPISSLLVYYQDRIMPIRVNDIAFFYLENEITHIVMFDGKKYYPNKTLEELEKTVGNTFFRANRQFLVSRKVVQDVSSFFGRKLSLNLTVVFEGRITVSKEKTPIFLEWLSSTDA
ncbi:MAG: LytTR family transcriptional regulator, partial [Chitinophagaceae bacterium]